MARSTFKQNDVTRALKAAAAAGLPVGRVEISPDGRIVVWLNSSTETSSDINPWDKVLTNENT
jgi:hypothetical protein